MNSHSYFFVVFFATLNIASPVLTKEIISGTNFSNQSFGNTDVTVTIGASVDTSSSDADAITITDNYDSTFINSGSIIGNSESNTGASITLPKLVAGGLIENHGSITGQIYIEERMTGGKIFNLGSINNLDGSGIRIRNPSGCNVRNIPACPESAAMIGGSIINNGDILASSSGIYIVNGMNGGEVINSKSGEIFSDRDGIYFNNGFYDGYGANHGDISAGGDGIYFNNGLNGGLFENTGSIVADDDGIYFNNGFNGGLFENTGLIDAGNDGIYFNQGLNAGSFVNTGTITGESNGITFNKGVNSGSFVNFGEIIGDENGIYLEDGTPPTFKSFDDDLTFLNAGTVRGGSGRGFFAEFEDGTFTNSGIISGDLAAISLGDGNWTINLNSGSLLLGDFDVTSGNNVILNFGAGLSAVVRVSDALPETITAPNDAFVVVDNVIYTADLTGFASGAQASNFKTGLVLNALNNRNGTFVGPTPTPGLTVSTKGSGAQNWGQFIGSGLYQPRSSTTAAYSSVAGGFVLGSEHSNGNGFFGGVSLGQTASINSTAFSTETIGVFAGFYSKVSTSTEFAISIGYNSNNNERGVAGLAGPETASANFGSFVVSPSLTMRDAFGSEGTEVRLLYNGTFAQGYMEAGSTADMAVGAQTMHMIEARVQHGMALWADSTLRVGADAQYARGAATSLTLAGSPLSIDNPNDGFAGRGFVALDFIGGPNMESGFNGTAEIGVSNNGAIDAMFSLKKSF